MPRKSYTGVLPFGIRTLIAPENCRKRILSSTRVTNTQLGKIMPNNFFSGENWNKL